MPEGFIAPRIAFVVSAIITVILLTIGSRPSKIKVGDPVPVYVEPMGN
jgi:hypothetical protein